MSQTWRVSVVMPAYNEAATIGDVIRRTLDTGVVAEVVVVDDGSTDGTAQAAEAAGARAVRNPYNIGNGASVRRGSLAATGDVVVMMDADGQHPPEAIPSLLARLGEYDMVVAARTRNSDTSKLRNFGNRMLIMVAEWISGRRIADLTSGFRAIKRDHLLEHLHLFPNRYSYPTTITLAMMMGGRFVAYEPVDAISRRVHGNSNISPVRDFLRFIAIMVRMVMLFSPQRLFVPMGGMLFLLSAVASTLQYIYTGGIHSAGLALFLSSVYIACFGLLADQVALLRRKRHD
ncbi:glycosyltransferase family 2 protein [Paramagnetospirillum magnetotacticum]|nr:glycosyltransferase family 2 protein [Paramagnetospirillum magnetotacticum]